jgi:bifunctional non-homologous end joining protein LigD
VVREGIRQGKLTVFLLGHKLRGGWTLVHTKDKNWLFLKKDDQFANSSYDVLVQNASVLSGLTIDDLKAGRLPEQRSTSLVLDPARATGARRGAMPRMLSPMLPSIVERPFANPNWLFEPKLDGYRVIATVENGEARLASRRGLDCSAEYPWLTEALRQQPYRDAIFDGEIVAVDEAGRPSFQLLQNRASEPRPFLLYYAFDLLYRDGYDLRGVPLEQRKALLDASLYPVDRVKLVDTFPEDGVTLYKAATDAGMEGVVAKRRDSRYETGKRTDAWLKIKATHSEEFVVGGYTAGSGSREKTFGSLVVGYYKPGSGKLTYVGHAGSGFDDRTLQTLYDRLKLMRTDESPFEDEVPRFGVAPPTAGRHSQRQTPGEPAEIIDELQQHKGEKLILKVEGHEIAFSNLNKVFWPAHGDQRALTKRDLVVYFARVAPYLLPHLHDRPLTLVRFPNGITGGHFYQKHWEQPLGPYVETVWLYSDQNKGDGEYLMGNNLPTLLWLAQVADIELHTWYSRINSAGDAEGMPTTFAGSIENMHQSVLNYPDFVVFDLDPYLYSGKEARGAEPELHPEGFAATSQVALWLKEMLDELGLASFVKTTGRTGLHIYVPIERKLDYHATHTISETLARHLAQQHPQEVTIEWAVDKRKGKVFADYNQNVRGKTLASIYSPRVLPWAAVSMPLRWDEVGKVFPTDFTILTAPDRLRQVGDLWSDILNKKHDLAGLLG